MTRLSVPLHPLGRLLLIRRAEPLYLGLRVKPLPRHERKLLAFAMTAVTFFLLGLVAR